MSSAFCIGHMTQKVQWCFVIKRKKSVSFSDKLLISDKVINGQGLSSMTRVELT